MKWEGNRESENVEDVRGDSGGGGGGGGFNLGGRSIGIGSIAIALIASLRRTLIPSGSLVFCRISVAIRAIAAIVSGPT